MCLLAYLSPGALPDLAKLETAGRNNPDGFGWAIVDGERIIVHRTMILDESLSTFADARAKSPGRSALWHGRIATDGLVDITNVHPFPIGGDPRLILAHNGVLPIRPKDGRSDTHAFAADLMRPEYLDDKTVFDFMESWIGSSKLVVLSVHPETEWESYIANEYLGDWEPDGSVWWSNESYKERTVTTIGNYRTILGFGESVEVDNSVDFGVPCPTCRAVAFEEEGECWECGSCLWCGHESVSCRCRLLPSMVERRWT